MTYFGAVASVKASTSCWAVQWAVGRVAAQRAGAAGWCPEFETGGGGCLRGNHRRRYNCPSGLYLQETLKLFLGHRFRPFLKAAFRSSQAEEQPASKRPAPTVRSNRNFFTSLSL